jgi:transcription initiation factor TFIID TATA-box-binding protein
MRKRQYTSLDGPASNLEGIPLPVVHNIVSTAQIDSSAGPLDLDKIRQLLPFSFYDRSRFAAITIRLSNPECTTLLFSSGKLVVTGGRTW